MRFIKTRLNISRDGELPDGGWLNVIFLQGRPLKIGGLRQNKKFSQTAFISVFKLLVRLTFG